MGQFDEAQGGRANRAKGLSRIGWLRQIQGQEGVQARHRLEREELAHAEAQPARQKAAAEDGAGVLQIQHGILVKAEVPGDEIELFPGEVGRGAECFYVTGDSGRLCPRLLVFSPLCQIVAVPILLEDVVQRQDGRGTEHLPVERAIAVGVDGRPASQQRQQIAPGIEPEQVHHRMEVSQAQQHDLEPVIQRQAPVVGIEGDDCLVGLLDGPAQLAPQPDEAQQLQELDLFQYIVLKIGPGVAQLHGVERAKIVTAGGIRKHDQAHDLCFVVAHPLGHVSAIGRCIEVLGQTGGELGFGQFAIEELLDGLEADAQLLQHGQQAAVGIDELGAGDVDQLFVAEAKLATEELGVADADGASLRRIALQGDGDQVVDQLVRADLRILAVELLELDGAVGQHLVLDAREPQALHEDIPPAVRRIGLVSGALQSIVLSQALQCPVERRIKARKVPPQRLQRLVEGQRGRKDVLLVPQFGIGRLADELGVGQ